MQTDIKGPYKGPLTEADRQYIRENMNTVPLRKMCRKLKRAGVTILDYIRHENLRPIDGRKITTNHPWRKANLAMEVEKKQQKARRAKQLSMQTDVCQGTI
jgi:hypothetical protein